MSRASEPSAGDPGAQPGSPAGSPRGHSVDRALHRATHRPVHAVRAADAAPAARLNRGDKTSAAGAVAALPLATATRTDARLDLHEGIAHPRESRCTRWPKNMRLASSTGTLALGRCRSTNKCDYCARLEAVEVSEMLALDALHGVAPSAWIVLTTRTATTTTARGTEDGEAFHNARRLVMRAIRRRWKDTKYVCICEFTTGYGPRSGGSRRPHWNVLLKGIPAPDLPELELLVRSVWCSHIDAEPQAQFVGPVSEVGGLMRYLALHFLKESQRPPEGWRGHRVTTSRSYYFQDVWKMRRDARQALRLKRELWRAEAEGLTGEAALQAAETRLSEAGRLAWECVVLSIDSNASVEAHSGARTWSDVATRVRYSDTSGVVRRVEVVSGSGEIQRLRPLAGFGPLRAMRAPSRIGIHADPRGGSPTPTTR
jgi:hypothetical protein